jgi:hypothetical protein
MIKILSENEGVKMMQVFKIKRLFILIALCRGLIAGVPQLINYQGYLTDSDGAPLSGEFIIEFGIYDHAESGTLLWSETQELTISDGRFNTILGDGGALPTTLFDADSRFLAIKVESDPEMTPRKQITSVAYAFRSENSDSLNGYSSDDFLKNGQTNAVTIEMIDEEIISSIDGVTNDGGNVDLVAGSNISIAADDVNNQITISATVEGDGVADNLGNHQATQNLNMNGYWINNDGGGSSVEGIYIDTDGKVGIGTHTPSEELTLWGTLKSMTSETGSVNAVEGIAYDEGDQENRGGKFLSYGTRGIGVMGVGMATTDVKNYGGYFIANGEMGIGATGLGQGNEAIGLYGKSTGNFGTGVSAEAAGNQARAFSGIASGEEGIGVYGQASYSKTGSSENNYGGYFLSNGIYGIGVYSEVTGQHGKGIRVEASGANSRGIEVTSTGESGSGITVDADGESGQGIAAYVEGNSATALYGSASGDNGIGIHGISREYEYGNDPNYAGLFEAEGDSARGLYAQVTTNSADIVGLKVVVPTGRQAAQFYGNVDIYGTIYKPAGAFKIDHPNDPKNKYLQHSFVESPEMLNIYNGTVTLDGNGGATVALPDYFDALNKDFQYQLTPIGAPMPNLYIAQKIEGNKFMIGGGEPKMEVSWQVTGVRNDTYAKENRIAVEVDKKQKEIGTYQIQNRKNMERTNR